MDAAGQDGGVQGSACPGRHPKDRDAGRSTAARRALSRSLPVSGWLLRRDDPTNRRLPRGSWRGARARRLRARPVRRRRRRRLDEELGRTTKGTADAGIFAWPAPPSVLTERRLMTTTAIATDFSSE